MAPRREVQPDGLETYRKKRDFERTSEPPPVHPSQERAGEEPIFVVHKHDATRLHYDLRLEIGGALPSWAIPKGPSYDPAEKRLAVETEDHPLAYADFEGRIPDDEYGGGDSLLWDRGSWETVPPGEAEEQLAKGHLHLRLHGEKLDGEWHLIRTRMQGKKQQWLFIKAHDGNEDPSLDIVAGRPESVKSGRRVTRGPVHRSAFERPPKVPPGELLAKVWPPMFAELAAQPPSDEASYLYEVKYDGFRALAALANGRLVLRSRNDLDLAERFPQVAKDLRRLRLKEAVLDGEIISLDEEGRSSFQRLSLGEGLLRFAAFDLLWLDGEDLRHRPLEERREYLESVLLGAEGSVVLAERLGPGADAALAEAKRRGLEGVIAKRRGCPYVGRRSRTWLKLKLRASQEVTIVGYTPLSTGAAGIGALLVAVRSGDDYRYVGKVGTGFSDRDRRTLQELLIRDKVRKTPVAEAPKVRGATWVKPIHVAEVEFVEWTGDGRLRQPSFKGLRMDKGPEETAPEAAVSEAVVSEVEPESALPPTLPKAVLEAVAPTHPERVVYPDAGYTKGDVFTYMARLAPIFVKVLRGRPLFFQQWPQGIHREGFYRQNMQPAPDFVSRIQVRHSDDRLVHHVVIDKPETVLWLANQSAFAFHMWSSSLPHLELPDWVVFDLDPGDGPFSELVEIAVALRDFLLELGLVSFPKTSGKRGLHVLAPIRRGPSHEEATQFAVGVTSAMAKVFSKIASVERTKSKRGGKLYLDALQNGQGKAIIAPYSLRDTPQATVSAPLEWGEVTPDLDPTRFTLETMPARLAEKGELFGQILRTDQPLPKLR